MTQHIRFMDGLRGIAILMVLLYHTYTHALLPDTLRLGHLFLALPATFIHIGYMGVHLFFFLSGFALFYPYAQHLFEGRPLQTLYHYIDRRISKILPSYLVALTVLTIFYPLPPLPQQTLAAHFFRHLFFIHSFWGDTFYSINGAFWSLATEMQFYVLFPAVAWCMMRAPWWTFGALITLPTLYRVGLELLGIDHGPLRDQLPAWLDLFGCGSFAAYLIVRDRARDAQVSESETRFWTIVACSAATLFYVSLSTLEYCSPSECGWMSNGTRCFFIGLTLLAMCVGIARGAPVLRYVLENPVLIWFSVISYNLYLWNDNILDWYMRYGSGWISTARDAATLNAILILSLLSALAWAVTTWIEKPLLRKGLLSYFARPHGSATSEELRP
jgi:peptidoglycan/LPS O-acetylase OafA/YrhL